MSQINVNNIRAKDGVSAVGFPGGINATGVVTATTFKGALEGNVTGNTSGTAGGLTGTPNITVGTVTGTDATFSGNLTVQGTTTTIDTAITEVDSLAVDGNVGIGSTLPAYKLDIRNSGTDNLRITTPSEGGVPLIVAANSNTATPTNQFFVAHSAAQVNIGNARSSNLNFHTGNTERLRIDQHGTTKFKGPLTEKTHYDNNALTGDYNHDLITHGNVYWSYTAASGAFTFNLRGSATVDLNDMMDTGESLSFLLAAANNNTSNYMTAFKVDGNPITGGNILWSGGSAPSAGTGSGTDVYSFTVFKTGNATFRAFASLTNHA